MYIFDVYILCLIALSSAPRRRSQGTDILLIPPTSVKQPAATAPSSAPTLTVSSGTSVLPVLPTSAKTSGSDVIQNPDLKDMLPIPVSVIRNRSSSYSWVYLPTKVY